MISTAAIGKENRMRPIDADALEKMLGDWIRDHWTDAFTGDDAGSEFADIIDHVETIEQSPVVHAHWIRGAFADLTCSNCKFSLCVPYSVISKLVYCPHCGAIVGEEVEKND